MSGWFAIKHGIRNHPIFKGKPERLGAWVAMLDEAAFSDTEQDVGGQLVRVRRGELCASQAMLESITGLPRQKLRTFLSALESAGTIRTRPATKSTKSRTIVTFCNYDKYQAPQPKSNQRATKEQPTKEQGNNIPVGSAKALDPDKVLFDSGVQLLTSAGVSEKQARSMIGKWRGAHGTEAVITAIGRANREGAVEPKAFIEGCLKFQAKKARPEIGATRITPDGRKQVYVNHYDGWVREYA